MEREADVRLGGMWVRELEDSESSRGSFERRAAVPRSLPQAHSKSTVTQTSSKTLSTMSK